MSRARLALTILFSCALSALLYHVSMRAYLHGCGVVFEDDAEEANRAIHRALNEITLRLEVLEDPARPGRSMKTEANHVR